jgi:V/A-type H+-transporting ATPase subunit I
MVFNPTSMFRLNIFVPERDIQAVTVTLGRLEKLHLIDTRYVEGWERQTDDWAERADQYASMRRRLDSLLDTLGFNPRQAPAKKIPESVDSLHAIREQVTDLEQTVQKWQQREQSAQDEAERLRLLLEGMNLLRPLDISIDKLHEFEHIHFTVGMLPEENLSRLRAALFRIPFVIIPAYEYEGYVLIFAGSTQEGGPILVRALKSALFSPLELPEDIKGPPDEILKELNARLEEVESELEALDRERRELIEERREHLLSLWRGVRDEEVVSEVISRFGRHGEVFLISGWVPEGAVDDMIAEVKATSDQLDIEILEPHATSREKVPTLLHNPAFLRPFENIVSTFGEPNYREIDPTPLVALTFVLMYGMMFGDVGHGLLLALAGLWLSRREGGLASLGPVIAVSGGHSAPPMAESPAEHFEYPAGFHRGRDRAA